MRNLLRLCAAAVPALALCLALPLTSYFSSSAAPARALAGTITVNSTADVVANDGQCTLREALTAAANDAPSGPAAGECAAGSGDDTININVNGTIELTDMLSTTTNVSIVGPGSGLLTLKSVGSPHRVFFANVSTVSISGLTITGGGFNPGGGSGGGLINGSGIMTLTDVFVTDNHTPDGLAGLPHGGSGGGIYNSGALTLINCVVSGNSTGSGVTGTFENGTGGRGGGIDSGGGSLTLINSVVSGNSTGGGPGGSGPGGGFFVGQHGAILINSTVSGNSTGAGGVGGGMDIEGGGDLKLTNSTITANSGVGVVFSGATATVANTIIAGNGGPDVSGAFSSQGHNLVGNAGSATGFSGAGDNVGTPGSPVNARLGPLANNGGPTQTHALLAGSPALDAGDNALARDLSNNPLTTDQRGAGFARFADAADADTTQTVDIGAYEAHPSVEDISDRTTGQNVPLSFSFNVGDAALGISSVTASSDNTTLVPNDASHVSVTGAGSARTLQLTPASGQLGTATITVTVTGTNGRSMSDTFVLTVVPVNQAPTLNSIGDLTINEDAGTQTVNLGGISAGAGETQNLTVTASSSDTTLIPNPTVTYTSPAATGSISFAPVANKSGGPVTITVTVKDDGGTANGGVDTFSRTFTVTVTAVNDAPVNTVPGAQSTIQHAPVVFSAANSNAISVADIDAGTDAVKVTLNATGGTITLGSTAGLTFVTGDGTDDASVSFTGTLASVNAALNGLSFKPAQGFSGAANLQVVTDDLGHNGSGGALSDTDSVTINVAAGGTLQFSASNYEVNENGSSATITVTRTGGSAGAASVNYSTSGGTATGGSTCSAGVDYVSASGTLNWADGETASKTFSVILCNDFGDSGDETVGLSLNGATGSATVGTPATATLTIKDFNPSGGVVQFSQDGYSVAEGVVALTVTVQRSGNTTSAADVDYATDDGSTPSVFVPCSSTAGLALDRCDYTKALGTLHFAAGETSKTFQVLISDDSYTEGSETAQLKLSNPTNGAQLGPRATAVMTLTDNSPESTTNPIDDDTKFVTQHYHDFLNREPDAPGLAFWVGEITSCGADAQCREVKRINVSAAFFVSIEFQNTGYLVERVYKTAYGDATSPNVAGTVPVVRFNEFLPDTQRIGKDVIVGATGWEQTLEANKQAYALEFVQRQRFLTAFPASLTAAQFVDKLAQNAGVTLTTAERDALISTLGATPADATKRAQVLRSVADHQQLRQAEFNRAFVLMQYFGYLRRDPDAAPDADFRGWKFWLDKLNDFNGDYIRAEMVKAFISSDEYRHRFGQ